RLAKRLSRSVIRRAGWCSDGNRPFGGVELAADDPDSLEYPLGGGQQLTLATRETSRSSVNNGCGNRARQDARDRYEGVAGSPRKRWRVSHEAPDRARQTAAAPP